MFGSRTLWDSGHTCQLPGSQQICISFGLLEVEIGKTESWRNTYRVVDLNTTRFVPGGFYCTNSPPSCTWWKVMDGNTRKGTSLPKDDIRICRVFRTLGGTKHVCFTLFITRSFSCNTTPINLSKPDPMNCVSNFFNRTRSQEFHLGFRNSVLWFPGNVEWKRPKKQHVIRWELVEILWSDGVA